MKSRIRSLIQLGVLVFIVAISLYVYMTWFMFTEDKIDKVLLDMPIDLTEGSSYNFSFSPNFSAAYVINLNLKTNIFGNDLSLLFKEQDISINWSLKSYGNELSSNVIDDNNYQGMHLISGCEYTLDVYVKKGSQEINKLSPNIRIMIIPHKGTLIRSEPYIRLLIITCFITSGGLLLLSGLLFLLKIVIKKITYKLNKQKNI